MCRICFGAENSGLGGEAKQVVVAGEQFFRPAVAEAPVERIDEVESGMSGDELEGSSLRCSEDMTYFE